MPANARTKSMVRMTRVKRKSKHAVLGAGGGGQVFAADLALRGHDVSICDFAHDKCDIIAVDGITVKRC